MTQRKLGRGLQALLGGSSGAVEPPVETRFNIHRPDEPTSGEMRSIAIVDIDTNPYQPRRQFDAGELQELTASIRKHGVVQPIVVRTTGNRFQLVAGERRLRASQAAGLVEIPARIIELDERQTFEIALVENLQRKDLNAIEKAQAFQEYIAKYGATHENLAQQLGVDRSTVTNLLRLLELPDEVQSAVRAGKITNGHARALLAVDDSLARIDLCRRIITDGLSVRQVEALVRDGKPTTGVSVPETVDRAQGSRATGGDTGRAPVAKSNHVLALEADLCRRLAVKVEIKPSDKDKGTVVLHFHSTAEFERIAQALGASQAT